MGAKQVTGMRRSPPHGCDYMRDRSGESTEGCSRCIKWLLRASLHFHAAREVGQEMDQKVVSDGSDGGIRHPGELGLVAVP